MPLALSEQTCKDTGRDLQSHLRNRVLDEIRDLVRPRQHHRVAAGDLHSPRATSLRHCAL